MATVAHCLYCFVVLVAHLGNERKHPSLVEVQQSWDDYSKTLLETDREDDIALLDAVGKSAKQLPALRRLADTPASSGSSASSASSSLAPSNLPTPGTSTTSLATTATLVTSPTAKFPLFVTWNTVTGRRADRSLRGCIGTFEEQPLSDALADYAVTSAVHDSRFSPIKEDELPSLEVAVTLLTDFEDADDAMDWTLGTHGLRITFTYHGHRYGATYLPDVAVEQGWTKEETLVSLMRKAGWAGSRSRWRDVELKVVRYQGKKESLTYGEYEKWADWREAAEA